MTTPRAGDTDIIPAHRLSFQTLAAVVGVAAILHFGAGIFVPLAIAMLITFALSPLVSLLRNRGMGKLLAVLLVVAIAFLVIGAFLTAVAVRLVDLAQELPRYQGNIVSKLEALQAAGSGSSLFGGLSGLLESINTRLSQVFPTGSAPGAPVVVDVVEQNGVLYILQQVVLPIVSPLATVGLVAVIVVFMLMERDSLRDRFIRLVGTNDLHRTTGILEDAGSRVGRYLILQLLVNLIYAVPIWLGLWMIGVPHALLWGLLTLVLRFVPYIGSVLAAAFPLILAVAASPDWSLLFWTAALFIVVELITSNLIEPVLYGSGTGVSPLAIIVSAIVWAWIWGLLGLVLSTPLTVCLVVLGRHLPQFALFDILFGDQPMLSPQAQFYQRLLAGDIVETSYRAEEALEDMPLAAYYRDIAIPALLLAQADYDRGVLRPEQENRIADAATIVMRDLEPFVAPEVTLEDAAEGTSAGPELPALGVVCIGGRRRLDDVAAGMLGQVLTGAGAVTRILTRADLASARFSAAATLEERCAVIVFLDPEPSRASLLQVRRIKRAAPRLRVGVLIWQAPDGNHLTGRVSPDKLAEATAMGADFVATDAAAVLRALHDPAMAGVARALPETPPDAPVDLVPALPA